MKRDILTKIMELIEKEKIGISITRISQFLNISRPTVYKYLRILAAEKKVHEIVVAGKKFWSVSGQNPKYDSTIISLYHFIIAKILQGIDHHYQSLPNWKEVGKQIANEIQIEDLLDTEHFFEILVEKNIVPSQMQMEFLSNNNPIHSLDTDITKQTDYFSRFKPFLSPLIELIFSLIENCDILVKEFENPFYLEYTLSKIDFLKQTQFVELFIGILEVKLNDNFPGIQFFISKEYLTDPIRLVIRIHFFHFHQTR